MEPQRLSLPGANSPIALRARCWEPGHDADRVPRPPRDTAGGIADGDIGVAPLNVSVLTIESSAVPPPHQLSSIYSAGLCSRAVRLISRGN